MFSKISKRIWPQKIPQGVAMQKYALLDQGGDFGRHGLLFWGIYGKLFFEGCILEKIIRYLFMFWKIPKRIRPQKIPQAVAMSKSIFLEREWHFGRHGLLFWGICGKLFFKGLYSWENHMEIMRVLKDPGAWMGSPWEMVSSYFGEWKLCLRSCILMY